jgi:hypothetical protein
VQLNRLHGVISQKIILFITTAVKTSNPTFYCFFEAIGEQYLAGFGCTYFFHPEDGGDMFL